MKCPACNEKAISLAKWGSTTAVFKTSCQNCNAALKANRVTWIGFLITAIVCVALIVVFHDQFSELKQSLGTLNAYLLGIGIPSSIGGLMTWYVGGYEKAE